MNRKERAAWIAATAGSALIAVVAIILAQNRASDRAAASYSNDRYATGTAGYGADSAAVAAPAGDEPAGWKIDPGAATPSEPRRSVARRAPRYYEPRVSVRTEPVRRSVASAPGVVVPAGTPVHLSLGTSLSTKTGYVGQPFSASVTSPVYAGGRLAIPSGAHVSGHVVSVQQPGKASGRAMMQLAFDRVRVGGRSYALNSIGPMMRGKGGTKKDVAMIGGGAVAGAVLGQILGGHPVKGAVLGGAAGTAASLMTRGPQLHLGAGSPVSFTLDQSVRMRREARA